MIKTIKLDKKIKVFDLQDLKSFIQKSVVDSLSEIEHFYVRGECYIAAEEALNWLFRRLDNQFKNYFVNFDGDDSDE